MSVQYRDGQVRSLEYDLAEYNVGAEAVAAETQKLIDSYVAAYGAPVTPGSYESVSEEGFEVVAKLWPTEDDLATGEAVLWVTADRGVLLLKDDTRTTVYVDAR